MRFVLYREAVLNGNVRGVSALRMTQHSIFSANGGEQWRRPSSHADTWHLSHCTQLMQTVTSRSPFHGQRSIHRRSIHPSVTVSTSMSTQGNEGNRMASHYERRKGVCSFFKCKFIAIICLLGTGSTAGCIRTRVLRITQGISANDSQ